MRVRRKELVPSFVSRSCVEPNTSVIAAMSRDGVIASMMIQSAFNREAVAAFIREFVLPLMTRHSIIVWDNARIHTDAELIAEIERRAGCVEFLPAYSPDFNPIEHCISKVKAILRRLCARTERALRKALKTAFEEVRPKDVQGWFRHCGYAYS